MSSQPNILSRYGPQFTDLPFMQMLTRPVSRQAESGTLGYSSPTAGAGYVGLQFLEGAREARLQKYLEGEREKRDALTNFMTWGEAQKARLTPEGLEKFADVYEQAVRGKFAEETKEEGKGGGIAGFMRSAIIGLTGGEMKGGAPKVELEKVRGAWSQMKQNDPGMLSDTWVNRAKEAFETGKKEAIRQKGYADPRIISGYTSGPLSDLAMKVSPQAANNLMSIQQSNMETSEQYMGRLKAGAVVPYMRMLTEQGAPTAAPAFAPPPTAPTEVAPTPSVPMPLVAPQVTVPGQPTAEQPPTATPSIPQPRATAGDVMRWPQFVQAEVFGKPERATLQNPEHFTGGPKPGEPLWIKGVRHPWTGQWYDEATREPAPPGYVDSSGLVQPRQAGGERGWTIREIEDPAGGPSKLVRFNAGTGRSEAVTINGKPALTGRGWLNTERQRLLNTQEDEFERNRLSAQVREGNREAMLTATLATAAPSFTESPGKDKEGNQLPSPYEGALARIKKLTEFETKVSKEMHERRKAQILGTSAQPYSGGSRETIENVVREAARRAGVDERLAVAVARQESGFNPAAVSRKGAVGVMQLMPDTAQELGVDPNDFQGNVDGGVRYLKQMLERYGGDTEKAVAAYNTGPGAVDQHKGVPPYDETLRYVRNVMQEYGAGTALPSVRGPQGRPPIRKASELPF